jgi:hypothetical protein
MFKSYNNIVNHTVYCNNIHTLSFCASLIKSFNKTSQNEVLKSLVY